MIPANWVKDWFPQVRGGLVRGECKRTKANANQQFG
jgi:hypothetical protein